MENEKWSMKNAKRPPLNRHFGLAHRLLTAAPCDPVIWACFSTVFVQI